jgi:hypothetical protein
VLVGRHRHRVREVGEVIRFSSAVVLVGAREVLDTNTGRDFSGASSALGSPGGRDDRVSVSMRITQARLRAVWYRGARRLHGVVCGWVAFNVGEKQGQTLLGGTHRQPYH